MVGKMGCCVFLSWRWKGLVENCKNLQCSLLAFWVNLRLVVVPPVLFFSVLQGWCWPLLLLLWPCFCTRFEVLLQKEDFCFAAGFLLENNSWQARDLAKDTFEWFLLDRFGELDVWLLKFWDLIWFDMLEFGPWGAENLVFNWDWGAEKIWFYCWNLEFNYLVKLNQLETIEAKTWIKWAELN